MQAKSAFIPRAQVHVDFDKNLNFYQIYLTEDVINKQEIQKTDNSQNSHMIHGLGCWDIDKTYWNNFQQNKKQITGVS